MNIEHRKFVRHQIHPRKIFLYSNYSPVKGWVKDISKGGMSFEYTPLEECEPKSEISVILTGETLPFYLPDVHCKTIYNIKVDKNDRPYNGTIKRRFGVQYDKLDSEMQEKLDFLLSSEIILPGI